MCLTIPGKICSINDGKAIVENGSRKAQIDLGLCLNAKVGDWVLYATDRAVKMISDSDAREIISLLEDHYNPVDVSALPLEFKKILFKTRSERNTKNVLTKEDIVYLLNLKGKNNLETLYAEANSLRKEMIEDFVCIHGIIEFSNYCKNSCLYCGIRSENHSLNRYRMNQQEIVNSVVSSVENEGYKLIVLQSGEDNEISDEFLISVIKEIKKRSKVFIFISVGERSEAFYREAKLAGASGSLIRFETSNAQLYAKLRPGKKIEDRISLIKAQQKMGYYVATGGMVGLPDQSLSDIADDLLMIKNLGVPMISSGPFIPSSNTPLENVKFEMLDSERIELFLKYIAIARLMMPKIKIPVTTALETLDPEKGRHRGLLAGANALMFNLTPDKYCSDYNIYDNKYREREKVWQEYGLFQGEESWEMIDSRLKEDLN